MKNINVSVRQIHRPHFAHSSCGFGLMEVMLILILLVSAVSAGFVYLKSHAASTQATSQSDVLNKADKAIAGFAARNFRLPCPGTAGNGVENCASGVQKGVLPYKTLGLEGYGASPQLKYIVYRSTANDLAVASNRFDPHDWDGASLNYAQVNGADLCTAIAQASQAGASTATAHVVDSGSNPRQVAYALAHPGNGDADGDGNVFDGRNANASPEMEAPERGAALGSYDDQVITRSMDELATTTNCKRVDQASAAAAATLSASTSAYLDRDGNLTGSLDGLGFARDVVNEVNSQKLWTTVSAGIATAISAVKIAVVTVKIIIAAGKLSVAITTLSIATADLSAAIAACAVIVGCFEIPHAAASVAAAAVAVTAGGVAIVANVAAIAALAIATALNVTAVTMAGVAMSGSSPDLTQALSSLQNAYAAAQTQVTTAVTNYNNAVNNAATATTNKNNAWNDLFTTGHNLIVSYNNPTPPNGGTIVVGSMNPAMATTANDGSLNNVQSAAATLEQARLNVNAAQTDLNTANNTVSQINASITTINGQIAATQAQIPTATATTNPTLSSLQTQLANQHASLASSQTQLTAAQTDVASKTSALSSAQAAQTNAQSAYDTARANAINAFNLSGTYTYTYNGSTPNNSPCGGTNQPACQAPNNASCGGTNQSACTYTYTATATSTVDGRSAITGKIDTWFPLYDSWYLWNSKVTQSQSALTQANNAANSALTAYNSLLAIQNGTTSPSTAVSAWSGPDAIVKAADKKGALQ